MTDEKRGGKTSSGGRQAESSGAASDKIHRGNRSGSQLGTHGGPGERRVPQPADSFVDATDPTLKHR